MATLDADTFLGVVIFVTALLAVLFWAGALGRSWMLTAPVAFMFFQLAFFVGSLRAVDLVSELDRQWIVVELSGLAAFVVGVWAASAYTHFQPGVEIRRFVAAPLKYDLDGVKGAAILGTGVVCCAVGAVFAVAAQHNVFSENLSAYLSEGVADPHRYGTMRSEVVTERYLGVGYVMQFTAMLLPIVIYLMFFRVRRDPRPHEVAVLLVFLGAALYCMTVQGARGWLLHAAACFVFLTATVGPLPRSERQGGANVVKYVVAVAGAAFYATAAMLMGRMTVASSSLNEYAFGAVGDLFDRIMGFEAEGQLILMRHFFGGDPVWGAEWWDGISRIIPFYAKAHGFGSELHALLYRGNDSGSLGLTTWGSAWYNWGTLGPIFVGLAAGWGMQYFTAWYVRGERTVSRVVILFVAGYHLLDLRDPYSFLLDGFPTTLGYLALLSFVADRFGRTSSSAATPALGAPTAAN